MTTTSYEVSKKLKEFLGDSAPYPSSSLYISQYGHRIEKDSMFPAYTLEDLLSKPFCEVISKRLFENDKDGELFSATFNMAYYLGGFPAVEAELLRLMEGK